MPASPSATPQQQQQQQQQSGQLQRLPIPPLGASIAAYLESVKPWLEELGPEEQATFLALVRTFQATLGPVLQERLVQHDHTQPHSWLEGWWLSLAYHTWREPLVIHSNWYIAIAPTARQAHGPEVARLYASRWANGFSKGQVLRASGLVASFLEYHRLVLA